MKTLARFVVSLAVLTGVCGRGVAQTSQLSIPYSVPPYFAESLGDSIGSVYDQLYITPWSQTAVLQKNTPTTLPIGSAFFVVGPNAYNGPYTDFYTLSRDMTVGNQSANQTLTLTQPMYITINSGDTLTVLNGQTVTFDLGDAGFLDVTLLGFAFGWTNNYNQSEQTQYASFLWRGAFDISIFNVFASPVFADSATITWDTGVFSTGSVEYGTDTNYGQTVVAPALTTVHQAQLKGLLPDTVYHYRVHAIAGFLDTTSPDHQFLTQQASVPQLAVQSITPSRLANGIISLRIVYKDVSNVAIPSLVLTSASLGIAPIPFSPTLPAVVGTMQAGDSRTVSLQFPSSAGSRGLRARLLVNLVSGNPANGGTSFTTSASVVLP